MNIQIREIEQNEIEHYRELRLQGLKAHPDAFGESAEAFSAKSIEEIRTKFLKSKTSGGFILGAFVENKLVGTVALGREAGEKSSHRATLWGMYVDPEFRNRNIGVRLLEQLLFAAKKIPGLEQVHLCVSASNLPGLRIYERLGFKSYGTDPKVLKVGSTYYDEHLMMLYLHAD